jgi:hypothetical protein
MEIAMISKFRLRGGNAMQEKSTKFVQVFILPFLVICLSPITVSAQLQSVGQVSFLIPNGWTYDQKNNNPDIAIISAFFETKRLCSLIIGQPVPRSRNPEAGFANAWNEIITPITHYRFRADLISEHTSVAGYSGKVAGVVSESNQQFYALFMLQSGTKDIPVTVVARTYPIYRLAIGDISRLLDSIRLVSVGPQAPIGQPQVDQRSSGVKNSEISENIIKEKLIENAIDEMTRKNAMDNLNRSFEIRQKSYKW